MKKSSETPILTDREAVQQHLQQVKPTVLRRVERIVGKLEQIGWLDMLEIMDSACRRIDRAVLCRRLAIKMEELTNFFTGVATKVALEKVRRARRERDIICEAISESIVEPDAVELPRPRRISAWEIDAEVLEAIRSRLTADEWEIVDMRLKGMSDLAIASALQLTMSAYRKRQQRLFTRINELLADEFG